MQVPQRPDQIAKLSVLVHPTLDGGLECPRDVDLLDSALESNGEHEDAVALATRALTVGLAAELVPHDERSVEDALALCDLGNAGTQLAFLGRHGGPRDFRLHGK